MKIRVVLFGASGMIGQGILHECLVDPDVTEIKVVVRRKLDIENIKLKQVTSENLYQLESMAKEFKDYDACFFALGVSSMDSVKKNTLGSAMNSR